MTSQTFLLFPLLLCISHVSGTRTCRVSNAKTTMNCSRLKLRYLPELIPPQTKRLDVSHNEIQTVVFTEDHYALEELDLSHNCISELGNGSFTRLQNLKVLKLNHNKLQLESSYPSHVFSRVPLQTLYLHHNDNNSEGMYPASLSTLTNVRELTIDTFTRTTFSHVFTAMINLERLLLGFESCKLRELKNETFLHLANLSIEVLSLNQCPLQNIEKNSFAPLKNLRKLYVSQTHYLNPHTAFISLYGLRTQSLDVLHLNELMDFNIFKTTNLRKFILSEDIVNYIKNVCVAELSLKHNQLLWIEYIDSSNSRFSECITHLDLSGNDMYGNMRYMFTLSNFPHLEYLNISRHFVLKSVHYHFDFNNFGYIERNYRSNTIYRHLNESNIATAMSQSYEQSQTSTHDPSDDQSSDQQLATTHNQLRGHDQLHFLKQSHESNQFFRKYYGKGTIGIPCPKSLTVADANGFSVNQLEMKFNISFTNAENLTKFRFAFNQVTVFNTIIIGLTALTELDISGNTCGNMTPTFFSEMQTLEKLNMSEASLNIPETYLLENGPIVFNPLRKLAEIDLSSNKLTRINPNIFAKSPLTLINLSNNRFINIPFDLKTTPLLGYLDLSINMISVLSQQEMDALDHLGFTRNLTINLKGNILTCDCDNLDFIIWLFNTHTKIENLETRSLTCIREDATYSTVDDTYRGLVEVWRRCYGRIWLSLSVTIFSGFCLSLTFAYIICWRKTLILNTLLRMFGYSNIITQQTRKDFRFDVFLGNSDHDDGFVLQTVSTHLESTHKLEVFISVRDMLPGRSIPQEIVRAIDSSWKVVLLITHAFLQDNWCRFITDYAIYVSTFRPPGSVLLVLIDAVNIGDIPPSLLNVVEEDHVFHWCEDSMTELDMWARVSKTVKKDEKCS